MDSQHDVEALLALPGNDASTTKAGQKLLAEVRAAIAGPSTAPAPARYHDNNQPLPQPQTSSSLPRTHTHTHTHSVMTCLCPARDRPTPFHLRPHLVSFQTPGTHICGVNIHRVAILSVLGLLIWTRRYNLVSLPIQSI